MNPVALQQGTPIKIAILAMGGQGGGCLLYTSDAADE